jgi:hypothetical protein
LFEEEEEDLLGIMAESGINLRMVGTVICVEGGAALPGAA